MPRLGVEVAITSHDVAAAQRLRHRVFVGEMGARAVAGDGGRERDFFDPWCEHLIVRDRASGDVVGTCRLLTAERAQRLETFCAERAFDLTRLAPLRSGLIEAGRACIAPGQRTGAVVTLLWSGIAALKRERGATHLIGCASISMADGGASAAAVYTQLARSHLAPIEYRATTRSPLAALARAIPSTATVPPLIRGLLRLGAWIGGEPAWDPEFNSADLLMFLPRALIDARQARQFVEERQAA
jgi:putative hemolysin